MRMPTRRAWIPWLLGWRKLRFTLVTAAFGALALLLGAWGALQPWAA